MNENTNPEVTTEETAAPVPEEIEEVTEAAEENAVETAESAAEETEENAAASAEGMTDITEPSASAPAEEAAEEQKKKKKGGLQVPVIISLCIVVAALLGYFVFTSFFLREPEGVTWSNEIEGATYYYEFKNDGTFNAYVGSIEINNSYQKSKGEDGNTITVNTNIGNFYGSSPATYSISGSRILGNQTMDCSYGEGYDFTLNQASRQEVKLELPEDFTPDEALLGTWVFKYMGYDIYKVTFEDNGGMKLEFVQDGITYNGVYTIEDGTVNFTYCVTENVAVPIEYKVVDNDNLTFMGYNFVREGSEAAAATADQQLIVSEQ